MRIISIILAGIIAVSSGLAADTAAAEDRKTLGFGRLFTNDFFGDGDDRWRSGSYSWSLVRGYEWNGRPPEAAFELMEYRVRTEIIAPRRLNGVGSDDRPYVGALTFGAHTHFARGAYDIAAGAEITAVGPQTGLGELQEWFHVLVDAPTPRVLDDQLENAVHFGIGAEVSRPVRLNDRTTIRPFAEVKTGPEDFARVGFDVMYGRIGQSDLLIRDVPTGQLYRGVEGVDGGLAFTFGADYTHVADSAWLPDDRGVTALDNRTRLRAGAHWQFAEDVSFFYGLTYLSEEFEGQPEGQLLGSLKLNLNF